MSVFTKSPHNTASGLSLRWILYFIQGQQHFSALTDHPNPMCTALYANTAIPHAWTRLPSRMPCVLKVPSRSVHRQLRLTSLRLGTNSPDIFYSFQYWAISPKCRCLRILCEETGCYLCRGLPTLDSSTQVKMSTSYEAELLMQILPFFKKTNLSTG